MSEGVLVAIIAGVQAVVLALIGKVARDSSVTRREVKNSHSTNLREELDSRHHETMSELRGIRKDVGRLDDRDVERGRDVRRIEAKLDDHIVWSREQEDRIDGLEDTLNPKKET